MKKKSLTTLNARTIIFVAFAIILITIYQLYWLLNYYFELKDQMNVEIQEVLRSSDFEELVHRVEEISKMDIKGRVDVNIGYDHENKKNVTKSSVNGISANDGEINNQVGTRTVVSPKKFGDILRKPEDLMGIGLNMQRGIHSSLDMIMDVDVNYLDSIITEKLDSIGLDSNHQLFYIKKIKSTADIISNRQDTLAKKGEPGNNTTNSFRLKVSDLAEYQMIIPQYNLVILKKMSPLIFFSLGTLILLVITFMHLIKTMRKQKELDEIKTDFTNNITHELKTPIAVAYAANDALLNFDSENNTPRMNRYLKICQEQLRLLDRLVEQILSLRMDRNKTLLLNIENIDLPDLIMSLVNVFKLKYPNKVNFTIDITPGVSVRTDRMHLSNIISNLIDNAIKYSKEPAQITITAEYNEMNDCVVSVRDEGIGMTKEQQKFIFDKYYRVPRGNVHDVKGYGLGLFYVKSMIEKLGGSVTVKSSLGKGSIFRLIFKNNDNE